MSVVATYLVDTSALARARHPALGDRLDRLLRRGLVATCALVTLEVLYTARSAADYVARGTSLSALPDVPITPDVTSRALDVQAALSRRGQHRMPVPDLVIAAAAESAGLTVLHYDADFERIAAVTGQPREWLAPRGSL